jgi:allantoate deiminase
MQMCDILGTFSEEPDRLTRPFASTAMRRANEEVSGWMGEAGMSVRRDNAGNLRGRYEASEAGSPTMLLGSHLDSVRGAGKYDGPLGVTIAIAAVQQLHDSGTRLPFAVEVVAFADEEGLRFGSTYLGSRALAGRFEARDLALLDSDGVSMADAIREFGGDPARIEEDRWRDGALLGYCEVHIEQGPALESRDLPVGIVSAIAGQSRFTLTFVGEAGHAGTVAMGQRHDALAAAAEFVLAVETEARGQAGLVATVGRLDVEPGAANVIPGRVELSLDVRHPDDSTRAGSVNRLLKRADEIAFARRVTVSVENGSDNPAVQCAPKLVSLLSRAVEEAGHQALMLPSGAGHDGVALAGLTNIGMLFVRCKGGISHNPAEAVAVEDVAVAIDVLSRFVELMAQAG